MPLTQYLKYGFDSGRPFAWHRQDEREARGLPPLVSVNADLEDWEQELVWTEILILSGSSDDAFSYLARAWGHDNGFHVFLSQFVGVPAAYAGGARISRHIQTSTIATASARPQQLHHPSVAPMDPYGGSPSDPHTADSFKFSGELLFEDLEQEVEPQSSEADHERTRPEDEQSSSTLFCQPCRETTV